MCCHSSSAGAQISVRYGSLWPDWTHPAVALVDHVVRVAKRHIAVSTSVLPNIYIHTSTSVKVAASVVSIRLTADVVPGARVRVAVGAAKVELEAVALVGDQVGVSVRRLTLGNLKDNHVRRAAADLIPSKRTVSPAFSATGVAATRAAIAEATVKRVAEKNMMA